MSDTGNDSSFVMRSFCNNCGGVSGRIVERGAQDCVYCLGCDKFQYNAPRTETGKAVRTVTTVHNGIKPKKRVGILLRAGGRCELCGATGPLHVGHIISVNAGMELGMSDLEINHDENLMALCAECNLGMGDETVPARIMMRVIRARCAT